MHLYKVADMLSQAADVNTAGHVDSTTSEASAHLVGSSDPTDQTDSVCDAAADPHASGGNTPTTAEQEFLEYVDRTVTHYQPSCTA